MWSLVLGFPSLRCMNNSGDNRTVKNVLVFSALFINNEKKAGVFLLETERWKSLNREGQRCNIQ